MVRYGASSCHDERTETKDGGAPSRCSVRAQTRSKTFRRRVPQGQPKRQLRRGNWNTALQDRQLDRANRAITMSRARQARCVPPSAVTRHGRRCFIIYLHIWDLCTTWGIMIRCALGVIRLDLMDGWVAYIWMHTNQRYANPIKQTHEKAAPKSEHIQDILQSVLVISRDLALHSKLPKL